MFTRTQMKQFLGTLTAIAGLSLGSIAQATILWDNGDYDNTGGSGISYINGENYESADDFYLNEGDVITDVHFTTLEGEEGYSGSGITWSIYSDFYNGSFYEPGSLLATGDAMNVLRTNASGDYWNYDFDLDFAYTVLSTDYYWLGLLMPNEEDIFWAWSDSRFESYAVLRPDGGSWNEGEKDLAFKLTTYDVPEPGTLALLGIGLAGMGRQFPAF